MPGWFVFAFCSCCPTCCCKREELITNEREKQCCRITSFIIVVLMTVAIVISCCIGFAYAQTFLAAANRVSCNLVTFVYTAAK